MPRFAANLTMMFTEVSFLDRFAAAAACGFAAVEFQYPYAHSPDAIARKLEENGLQLAMFNMPAGDPERGERGLAALPGRFEAMRAGVEDALVYAKTTRCRALHLLAGVADRSDPDARSAYRKSVAWTAARLADADVTLLIEPINRRDAPGYFLDDFAFAEDLIADLDRPNLRLQFDVYHHSIMHGDTTIALRRTMPIVGHVQIASVPSRAEPDGEEVNYPFFYAELDRLGYDGFVGCEYRPRAASADGLGWFKTFARTPTSSVQSE